MKIRLQTASMPRVVVLVVLLAASSACQATRTQPSPFVTPTVRSSSVDVPSPPVAASPRVSALPAPSPIAATNQAMESRYETALRLFAYERDAPLDVELGEATEESEILTQTMSYSSSTGQRVPGVLVGPRQRVGLPGVIWLGPDRAVVDRAQAMAQLGALVISIDPPQARRTGDLLLTFTNQDRDELIELMIELRRAVDVLIATGADPNRIAFVGYSWAGTMGAGLAGIEHRIRSYVLMFADGGLVEHMLETPDSSFGAALSPSDRDAWMATMEPVESLYFTRHAAPSEVFFQNGTHDDAVAKVSATRLHDAANGTKLVRWYDSGHDPTPDAPEVWCDQAKWLKQQLELSSSAVVECGAA